MSSAELDDPRPDQRMLAVKNANFLRIFVAKQKWDDVFMLVRSHSFLEALDLEAREPSSELPTMTPLKAIDWALQLAVELRRVGDIAALVLRRAYWAGRPRAASPLEALRSLRLDQEARVGWAQSLADQTGPERATLWLLILAGELADQGDIGRAQRILTGILAQEPMQLSGTYATRTTGLLHIAFFIDEEIATQLAFRLLADQARVQLCQHLLERGQYGYALLVTQIIESQRDRIRELATISLTRGDERAARTALDALLAATDEVEAIESDEELAIALGHAARSSADVEGGEAAVGLFLRAVAVAEQIPDPEAKDQALEILASMQLLAGLLGLAEETARRMTSSSVPSRCHERWEVLEAVAAAYARSGQPTAALRALRGIRPAYADFARAVRRTAQWITDERHRAALRELAAEAQGWDQEELADALEALWRSPSKSRQATAKAGGTAPWLPPGMIMVINNFAGMRRVSGAELSKAQYSMLLAEDEARRAAMLATAFQPRDDGLHADSLAPQKLPWPAREPSRTGAASRVYQAFHESMQNMHATESVPAYESERLWQLAEQRDSEGRGRDARTLFADALSLDQYGHFEMLSVGDDAPGRQTGYGSDYAWLRPVALASIAARQARNGDYTAGDYCLTLAEDASCRLSRLGRGRCQLALARADLELGRIESAFRRCSAYAAPDGLALSLALACVQALWRRHGRSEDRLAKKVLHRVLAHPERWGQGFDVVRRVACFLAEMGKLDAALELAAQLEPRHGSSEIRAVVAGQLALQGDVSAALALARGVDSPSAQADALRHLGVVLAARGDLTGARTSFEEADVAAGQVWPVNAPSVLVELATAECEAGLADLARQALSQADESIRAGDSSERLCEVSTSIAEVYAALGDMERAVYVATSINHPWFGPRALCIVAMFCGAQTVGSDAVKQIINRIDSPWWRAVGLAAVAVSAMEPDPGDGGREEWAQAVSVALSVPRGNARSRLYELIGTATLGRQRLDKALQCIGEIREGVDIRLPRLGRALLAAESEEATLALVPHYGESACTSLFACWLLAEAFPAAAYAVAAELDRYSPC